MLKQDEAAQRRLDNWLTLFLDSQLQAEADGEETSNDLHDILNKLLKYTQYTKVNFYDPREWIYLIVLEIAAIIQRFRCEIPRSMEWTEQ